MDLQCRCAEVAKSVDAPDSKSGGVKPVWVQVPPSVWFSFLTVLGRCLAHKGAGGGERSVQCLEREKTPCCFQKGRVSGRVVYA